MEGAGACFFGTILSWVGFCENPIKLVISRKKTKASLFGILPNLAVKLVKKSKQGCCFFGRVGDRRFLSPLDGFCSGGGTRGQSEAKNPKFETFASSFS